MRSVGIRELKNRLSEYLRRVRAGEEVLVTDRGEVVAELRLPRAEALDGSLDPGLEAAVARGMISRGAANDPHAYPPLVRLLAAGEAQRLLDAERGER
jgi:antitoxin (DNA-binding transcriptional repressor) of toxin-antitoxin stability system